MIPFLHVLTIIAICAVAYYLRALNETLGDLANMGWKVTNGGEAVRTEQKTW